MAIHADRVEFSNPNVPHYFGRIDPNNFTPFPKNPTICKFMLQMGQYEELGSGVRRVNQYLPHYAPGAGKPVFEDGEMFKVTVPLAGQAQAAGEVTGQVESHDEAQVTGQVAGQVLEFCRTPRKASDIQYLLKLRHRETFNNNYLHPLLETGWIERTIPDKPRSRLQKYHLTDKGRAVLMKAKES